MIDILNIKFISSGVLFYIANRTIYKRYCKPNLNTNKILYNKKIKIDWPWNKKNYFDINNTNLNFIKEIYGNNFQNNNNINKFIKIENKKDLTIKNYDLIEKNINLVDNLNSIWIFLFDKNKNKIIILNDINNRSKLPIKLDDKFYYEKYIIREFNTDLFLNLDLMFILKLPIKNNDTIKIYTKLIVNNKEIEGNTGSKKLIRQFFKII